MKRRRKIIKKAEARVMTHTVAVMLIATALTGIFLIGPLSPPTVSAASTDFSYSKLITIDNTKVEETGNYVIWVYNISTDFTDCQADGDDIAFFSEDNNTQYQHDIEIWNSTTGELGAWVNITSVSSIADTLFYIYYGDADGTDQRDMDGTWGDKYSAVYHMNVSDSTNLFDSSGNANHLAYEGSPTANVSGKLGSCMNFHNTTADEYNCTTNDDFNMSDGDFTIMVWAEVTNGTYSTADVLTHFLIYNGDATHFYALTTNRFDGGAPGGKGYYSNINDGTGQKQTLNYTENLDDDTWHFYCMARNGTTSILNRDKYINMLNIGVYGSLDILDKFRIGNNQAGTTATAHNGAMDEVWVIKGEAFSNETTNTTYNNQFDVTSFLTLGAEAGEGPSSPVNSEPSPANSATNVNMPLTTYSITVTDPNGDNMDVYLYSNNTADDTWYNWKSVTGTNNGSVSWVGSHDGSGNFLGMGSGDLDPNTKYWWSANTTDGTNWDNDTYYFTTNHTYIWDITVSCNVTNITVNSSAIDTQLVNYTYVVNNTGSGEIADINLQATWLNSTTWKFYYISSDFNMSNCTFYNDSEYISMNISNLSTATNYTFYMVVNITELVNDTVGTVRNTFTATGEYVVADTDTADIEWGEPIPEVVTPLADTVVNLLFIIIFVTLVLGFLAMFTKISW